MVNRHILFAGTMVHTPLEGLRHTGPCAALSNPALAPQPADDLRMALEAAERFISGFEGDEAQDGIADLMSKIRAALPRASKEE